MAAAYTGRARSSATQRVRSSGRPTNRCRRPCRTGGRPSRSRECDAVRIRKYEPSAISAQTSSRLGNNREPGRHLWLEHQKTAGVQIVQNHLSRRTDGGPDQSGDPPVKAGQSQFKSTEQSVLLLPPRRPISTWCAISRPSISTPITKRPEAAARRRKRPFRVGEVTRTDVARLGAGLLPAGARAAHHGDRHAGESDRANFQRVVGQAPGKLVQPVFKYELPDTLEDAVSRRPRRTIRRSSPPNIPSARRAMASILRKGARLPTIQIDRQPRARLSRRSGSNSTDALIWGYGNNHQIDTGSVEAVTWPLYTGGLRPRRRCAKPSRPPIRT